MQLELTAPERRRFEQDHALATDENGNEVLAGLSVEESVFLVWHKRRFLMRMMTSVLAPRRDDKIRAIELRRRHDISRLRRQWAESGEDEPTG